MRRVAVISAFGILVLIGIAITVTGIWWEVWLIGFPLVYGGVYGIIGRIEKRKSNGKD